MGRLGQSSILLLVLIAAGSLVVVSENPNLLTGLSSFSIGNIGTTDWIIASAESCNGPMTVNSNIIIKSGGALTMNNCDLTIASSFNGQHKIVVESGGNLDIQNSKITKSGAAFLFWVEPGAKFSMIKSKLSGVGFEQSEDGRNAGLWIGASGVTIQRNLISDSYAGLVLYDSHNNYISQNSFSDVKVLTLVPMGGSTYDCGAIFTSNLCDCAIDCSIYNGDEPGCMAAPGCGGYFDPDCFPVCYNGIGTLMDISNDASLTITNCEIKNCAESVPMIVAGTGNGEVLMSNIYIENSNTGISVSSGNLVLQDSTFIGNTNPITIQSTGGTHLIDNVLFENNVYGVLATNDASASLTIQNSVITNSPLSCDLNLNVNVPIQVGSTTVNNLQASSASLEAVTNPPADTPNVQNIGQWFSVAILSSSGWASVNIAYTEPLPQGVNEADLRMYYYNSNQQWELVQGSTVNTVDNYVSGTLTQAGIYAPMVALAAQQVCGNGNVESPEVCDGTDLANKTCANFGFTGGTLGCTGCEAFNTSACTSGTPITSCAGINASGKTYILQNNLTTTCEPQRSNVVLNCNGHSITGGPSGNGIRIGMFSNVTIRNCIITGWSNGILLEGATYSHLIGNTISNAESNAIYLFHASRNVITENTISRGGQTGIKLEESPNNEISNNTVTTSVAGIFLYSTNDRTTITGNTLTNNNNGIGLTGGVTNTIITYNNIYANNNYGISSYYAYNTAVNNNRIYNNVVYDVFRNGGSNNDFTNNYWNDICLVKLAGLEPANIVPYAVNAQLTEFDPNLPACLSPPVADFYANATTGNVPLTVQFTDTSTGVVTGWYWDFGDGVTSNEQNPVHTYTAPGTYTVDFYAQNSYGSSSKTDYITATATVCGNGIPEAPEECDDGAASTPLSCGVGACANTVSDSCVSCMDIACVPGIPTGTDNNCNGVDENCNGAADDNYVSTSTNCGVGACYSTGQLVCTSGATQDTCTPGTPITEVCNSIDDDCNGEVDNDISTMPTECGIGVCYSTGAMTCINGAMTDTCTAGTPTGTDNNCNGVDENCNGAADDNYTPTFTSCGVGVCASTGQLICSSGSEQNTCAPGTPTGNDDNCNGIDEDCSGTADNNYVPTQTTCGIGACASTGQLICSGGATQNTCVAGTPTTETCNNVDDNCNGAVDESLTQTCYSGPAGTQNVGICRGGTQTCSAGDWGMCAGEVTPQTEITCNGIDENCNGMADDGSGDSDSDGISDCEDACPTTAGFKAPTEYVLEVMDFKSTASTVTAKRVFAGNTEVFAAADGKYHIPLKDSSGNFIDDNTNYNTLPKGVWVVDRQGAVEATALGTSCGGSDHNRPECRQYDNMKNAGVIVVGVKGDGLPSNTYVYYKTKATLDGSVVVRNSATNKFEKQGDGIATKGNTNQDEFTVTKEGFVTSILAEASVRPSSDYMKINFYDLQGCPYGDITKATMHIVDQKKSGVCGYDSRGRAKETCEKPLEGMIVKVYDRNDAAFKSAYGSNPNKNLYDNIFEADIGLVGGCTTAADGSCLAPEEYGGKFIVIGKYVDTANDITIYQARLKNFKVKDCNRDEWDCDGSCKDEEQDDSDSVTLGVNEIVKTKNLRIVKMISKYGSVKYEAGNRQIIIGSELNVIAADYVVWENEQELYPFIFSSDTNWTVDVCVNAPTGYTIAGVMDIDGNILSTTDCAQTLIEGEEKVILFALATEGTGTSAFTADAPDITASITGTPQGETARETSENVEGVTKTESYTKPQPTQKAVPGPETITTPAPTIPARTTPAQQTITTPIATPAVTAPVLTMANLQSMLVAAILLAAVIFLVATKRKKK